MQVREEQALRGVAARLAESFAATPEQVEQAVEAAKGRFAGLPVREFVPILVERHARATLTPALSEVDGPAGEPKEVAGQGPVRRKGLVVGGVVVALVVAVVAVVVTRDSTPKPIPLTLVRGVVGSEKQAFFEDPQVRRALAAKGLRVDVAPAGSRQIATSIDLKGYDFAFPSSAPAAERIQRQRGITAKYTPFSSPMAIATFKPIADLLTRAKVVRHGAFDVASYLDLVGRNVRWDQLGHNTAYRVRKNVLVSTTDPRSSNSAAMYLAVAGFVANGDAIVQGADSERYVLPLMSKLFADQGYTESTTEGPFAEYLSTGMGPTPLVWIYEAQYVEAGIRGQLKPGMVLMYPSPTVLSKHTLVPLDANGDRVGRLLTTDPELQRLAAEHGFRPGEAAQFAKVTAEHRVPVVTDLVDVVDTPSYDTMERLLNGVAKQAF